MTAPTEPQRGPAPPLVVVVVADTRARARQLRNMLLGGPGFVVPADACSPEEAERAVVEHRPGAVLLDLSPEAGGLDAIERIMSVRATPIVVCGSAAERAQQALEAGAVDVVGALDALPTSPQYVTSLRRHLTVASRVRVITHPRGRLRAKGLLPREQASDAEHPSTAVHVPAEAAGQPAPRRAAPPPVLVAIGASTGGPPALATILAELPHDLDAAVLVVQHMAEGFVEGLAHWLDSVSALPVVLAHHGQRLRAGLVHVAPARKNTLVRPGLRLELQDPLPGQFHVPGIDATLTSVAATCHERAVGVLLTGMGRDGAAGLRKMRDKGAVTIGQDEPTSVVWGMPAAAAAVGAVSREVPLPHIAAALVEAVQAVAPEGAAVRAGERGGAS
jgi:two-component system, chemotaxis family, protein-glutamate methylesterase/glutaminase